MQARDAFALAVAFDWTAVVVALITLAGVVFNGLLGAFLVVQLRTPSGKRIGAQVEDSHHVALANHYRIRALAAALGESGEPDDPETRLRAAPDGE